MTRIVEDIFHGRIISVRREEFELPDGRRAVYEMVRHPGGAAVLPLLDDGRVILIRQFRPAGGGMVWEIPAGKLDPGETPEQCIEREIQEEIGYQAGKWEKISEMLTAVGFCDEIIHLYFATELSETGQALEPDEFIEIVPTSVETAMAMVDRGEITDGKTQLALLTARRKGLI